MKKTLGDRTPKPASASATPATATSQPAARFTPRGATRNRLLIAVSDGKIDFAAMDPEASKKLNELLHNPEVQAQFDIGPLTQKFTPEACARLYQALGKLMHTAGKIGFGLPEKAAAALEYTDKEQLELAKPTCEVLDQFAPKFVQENQSLISLAITFSAITNARVQEALMIARAELASRAPAAPIRTATPIPAPENKSRQVG